MAVSEGSYGTVVQYDDGYLNFTGVLSTYRSSLHLATAKLSGVRRAKRYLQRDDHIDFKYHHRQG